MISTPRTFLQSTTTRFSALVSRSLVDAFVFLDNDLMVLLRPFCESRLLSTSGHSSDDRAARPLSAGVPPFGCVAPERSLRPLVGRPPPSLALCRGVLLCPLTAALATAERLFLLLHPYAPFPQINKASLQSHRLEAENT